MEKNFISIVLAAAMLTGSIPLCSASAADIISGDVNGDGKLSISDVVMLSRYAGEDSSVKLTKPDNADVNQDGTVDFGDATAMLRRIARLPEYNTSENSGASRNLMANITANAPKTVAYSDAFKESQMDFSVKMLQEAAALDQKGEKKNLLISPTSAMYALAMTANGAKGDTLKEMEAVLGGGMDISELNQYLGSMRAGFEKNEKVMLTNAIWFRNQIDGIPFNPLESFLQNNADFYGAGAQAAPFDLETNKEINAFVNEKTKGMIPQMVREDKPMNEDMMMLLLNCLTFESKWKTPYRNPMDIFEHDFTCYDGTVNVAQMMYSTESTYLEAENATGFIKPYAGDKYSFAALLPDEGIDIFDFVADLDADSLLDTIKNAKEEPVYTYLPQFTYDDSIGLKEPLQNMGIELAFQFGGADFTGITDMLPINIYDVQQKTFISVNSEGTKAAAATAVFLGGGGGYIEHEVLLDRPFVYMILDNETDLPLFIGTLMTAGEAK